VKLQQECYKAAGGPGSTVSCRVWADSWFNGPGKALACNTDGDTTIVKACQAYLGSTCGRQPAACSVATYRGYIAELQKAFYDPAAVAQRWVPSPIALVRECGTMVKYASTSTSAAAMTACNAFAATTGPMKCNTASMPIIIRVCPQYLACVCGKNPLPCTAAQITQYTDPIMAAFVKA